jgi:hypothetical protein
LRVTAEGGDTLADPHRELGKRPRVALGLTVGHVRHVESDREFIARTADHRHVATVQRHLR